MDTVWPRLALYESRDLLSRYYRKKHGGDINATKAQEIIAHLAQGRDYFSSARQASELVKPLLQYYGVLALARAVILFNERSMTEGALDPSHGVNPHRWTETISDNKSTLLEMQLQTCGGTFTAFCKATRNKEASRIRVTGLNPFVIFTRVGTSIPEMSVVSLRDLLGRIPALLYTYRRVFEEPGFCHYVKLLYYRDMGMTQISFADDECPPNSDSIRRIFRVPEGASIGTGDCSGVSAQSALEYQVAVKSGDDWERLMPHVSTNASGFCFLIEPLSGGVDLSTASKLFLLSYAGSSLVRYYPSLWLSLTQRKKGDAGFPLLKEAIALIDEEFPRRVVNELEEPARHL